MASIRPSKVANKPTVTSPESDGFNSFRDSLLDYTERRISYTYFAVRMIVFFVVIPIMHLLWQRVEYHDLDEHSTFSRYLEYLNVFDARHFDWVGAVEGQEGGYNYEVNHAFYPILPWASGYFTTWLNWPSIAPIGWFIQIGTSYTNCILLYRVGNRVFNKPQVAELSAYLYILSHSMVYQLSFYSENTFLMFTLLGLYCLYDQETTDKNKDDETSGYHFWLPSNSRVLAACFLFGVATCTRSTGVLLSIFIFFFFANKIIAYADYCCDLVLIVFYCWLCMLIMFMPLWIFNNWKPYVLHCDTKLDRSDEIPEWCLSSRPDVYKYIQYTYWDNQFGGILYRDLDHAIVSIPMNFVFFYMMFRVMSEQGKNFVTCGVFKSSVTPQARSLSLFSQIEIVPHMQFMFLMLSVVLVFANADINSRVASVCPIYYWGLASMLIEGEGSSDEERTAKGQVTKITWPAYVAIIHNILYMVLNFVIFPMEVGFL